jgi:hypothetical protein
MIQMSAHTPIAGPSRVVGISAVLPGSSLLKRMAILFDRVACDDISVHVVNEASEGMRARSPAEWNSAYEARARELRWLRDAGVLVPLAQFGGEIGLSSAGLDEIRRDSQERAAPLVRATVREEAAAELLSIYERLLAGRLRSQGVVAASVSQVVFVHGDSGKDDSIDTNEVAEIIFGALPSADVRARWNAILELRSDPSLVIWRQDLWRLIYKAAAEDASGPEIRPAVEMLYDALERLLESHAVRHTRGRLQVVIEAPGASSRDLTSGESSPFDLTVKGRRCQSALGEHVYPGTPALAFTDITIHSDIQSEVPLLSFDVARMISLQDLAARL